MIKILDDTKTLSQLVADTSNGLGHLDPLRCTVTEELNGIFEAELEVLHNDRHFSDLHVGGILKMPVNDTDYDQLFRIYYISKEISQTCVVKCEHISYDLSKVPVEPFSATGASLACSGLVSHSMVTNPFSMTTDITNTTSTFTLDVPRSFRECLGGYEGSLLDTFRGEYKWDNLTVNYLARRGADNGVRISYGKNLTDFQQETNNAEVYTGVLGFATVDDTCYVGNVYNKTTGNKIKIVDFSSDYESGQTPTTAELTTKAQTYATNNDIEVPSVNIKISFVPLYQTEEYKNIAPLERVSLGDTVHVYFEKLGVEASSRVVKTVWNVLLNKYDSVELGSTKANLNTVINDSIESATSDILSNLDIDTGAIEEELSEMSQLIINGLCLHCTKVPLQSGGYRLYLHNADTLANSQYQYVITAQGFMVSDDYGQTWNSGWDAQGNVVVNSLATITLKFLEGYGMYMRFGDVNSNYIEVAPYSNSSNVPQGVSFDGTGTIRMQPQGEFLVNNKAVGGSSNYNRMTMGSSGSSSQGYITLVNNDDTHSYLTANWFYLYSHYGTNSSNMVGITNYATHTGTSYNANALSMTANAINNSLSMTNRQIGTSDYANLISISTNSTQNELYMYNYAFGGTSNVNVLQMTSTATTHQIMWRNKDFNTNSNDANYLYLETTASGNTIGLYNQNSSGTPRNYIKLSSVDDMIHMWSASDIYIQSSGAVRISSGSSQDITLTAADDLSLSYSDKLYIGGNQMSFKTFTVSGTSYTALCKA